MGNDLGYVRGLPEVAPIVPGRDLHYSRNDPLIPLLPGSVTNM